MRGRFNGRVIGQDYTGRNTRHNGRAGVYNAVQSAFAPSLDITLANGLGPLFTYTRATTATVKDWEGLIKSCLSGELRIYGARRVENLVATSEDLTSLAGGLESGSSATATTVTFSSSTGYRWKGSKTIAAKNGDVITGTVTLSSTNGKSKVALGLYRGIGASQVSSFVSVTLTTTPTRYRVSFTLNADATFVAIGFDNAVANGGDGTTTGTVTATKFQIENVTGQSNQNPSEYKSVGVLSSPYHGYFADGVGYYSYENGNTVSSNVVTEAQGAAITGAIGYLDEGARTNLQKQNRTLTTAPWTNSGTPAATQNATGIDGGTTAWTLTDNDAGAVEYIYCGAVELALSGSTQYTYSIFVGKQGSAPSGYPCISVDNGTYLAGCTIDPYNGTATVWTAYTGFTVLTSSATCSSWNSNFWRVELTFTTHSSMTNGTVAIIPAGRTSANSATGTNDVSATGSTVFDAPQIEAGAFASSPIITTTAAVARNADALTLPTAGIADGTVGTAFVEYTTYRTSDVGIPMIGSFASTYAVLVGSSGGNVVGINDQGVWKGSSSTFSTPQTTLNKIAATWGGSSASAASAGSASAISSFSGDLGLGTTLSIGMHGNALAQSQLYGVISKIKIYKQKMSNAQLQALTS